MDFETHDQIENSNPTTHTASSAPSTRQQFNSPLPNFNQKHNANKTPSPYVSPARFGCRRPHGAPKLIDTPPRRSYHMQMRRHWAITPQRPRSGYESRSASPKSRERNMAAPRLGMQRRVPPDINGSEDDDPDGGISLVESPAPAPTTDTRPSVTPVDSANDDLPLTDLERAVLESFDSPSPTRSQRRKTLHISPTGTPSHENPPLTHMPLTAKTNTVHDEAGETSSSEAWTGDDIFLGRASSSSVQTQPTQKGLYPCCGRGTTPQKHRQARPRFRTYHTEFPQNYSQSPNLNSYRTPASARPAATPPSGPRPGFQPRTEPSSAAIPSALMGPRQNIGHRISAAAPTTTTKGSRFFNGAFTAANNAPTKDKKAAMLPLRSPVIKSAAEIKFEQGGEFLPEYRHEGEDEGETAGGHLSSDADDEDEEGSSSDSSRGGE